MLPFRHTDLSIPPIIGDFDHIRLKSTPISHIRSSHIPHIRSAHAATICTAVSTAGSITLAQLRHEQAADVEPQPSYHPHIPW